MRTRLDQAKSELIDKAAGTLDRSRHPGDAFGALLHRYYRHVAPDDLFGRDPVDVCGAAMSHRALAGQRPQGTARVRVFTPTVEEHGWASAHTVVEIVTDDMPFLVDSVTAEVTRQERAIHLVIHPQMVVERTLDGTLVRVLDASASDPALAEKFPGCVVESWMHLEIDRESTPADVAAICADLQRVLRDVREAVEDWTKMVRRALDIADEMATASVPVPADDVAQSEELLRWLADDHFTFLGYREYLLVQEDGPGGVAETLQAVTGSGLGILRGDQTHSASFAKLPPEVRARAHQPELLILTKANSRSTVHRPAYLDYIGIKTFGPDGDVVGERRFLGLFTAPAYTESVLRIPVLRRKVAQVIAASGLSPASHDGKDVLEILETYPRNELFQTPVDELLATTMAVLHLQERRLLRLFVRRDVYGRFLSCLLYLPRDRYNTDVRVAMQDILLSATGGDSVDYTARITESVLARLHFVIHITRESVHEGGQILPDLDLVDLEYRLTQAMRSWDDDFADTVVEQMGEEAGARLLRRYASAFSESYRSDFPARTAVADLRRLEELDPDDGLAMNLYQPLGAAPHERRFKIYRTGHPISLTEVLPVLSQMGVEVVDEWPHEVTPAGSSTVYVYDFGLRWRPAEAADPDASPGVDGLKSRFQDAFEVVWRGHAESDGFNALVMRAGLTWRQAMVLRAYARYQRQAGATFSLDYLEECLNSNASIAALLVGLFEARFDPQAPDADRAATTAAVVARIEAALESVASLDQDRILRGFLTMIRATLRTNAYQTGPDGRFAPYLSLKLDSRALPDLPQPRPMVEIWVYAPRVEGVHLRFGRVARGGLRWSDRREDFRTEILGLVKAQAVKNAVIVPVGAKGGFVAKALPDPADDREGWLAEGIASYQVFIRGLLDLTDNRGLDGAVQPPRQVVRHDGDDTYLVVAADKGTAAFSDIANALSREYGYWLGDAFASGGSAGYDHKVMGITARGAWESVKRHFREMGRDCQTEDFTCVGVGDMSGDVFGNGMLLSEHIRLVAAFDHRHVFLDPDPDAAASWKERKRLFDLPRSSWADYDASLISPGGGVFPRSAKAVPVSAQVRAALGLADDVDTVTPAELMRAILTAPVDLLWNGGIGTYVKASTEAHLDAGDKANDAIRVDGVALRCACVGEGGNLGFTQLGRVEYARFGGPMLADDERAGDERAGGRINTDAIDNSAGVDTSDHEVNIKILLDRVVAAGDLTVKQRNELLAGMTDEVAQLVLADNYQQNVALASAEAQAAALMHVHRSFVRQLEADGLLDPRIEHLPTDRQLAERHSAGGGLSAPELAVLLAYTKNLSYDQLLETALPDDPYLAVDLHAYFPAVLRERYPEQIDAHPLRREIITTRIVNGLVNSAGMTFGYRLTMETGAALDELARAHAVAREVFDLPGLWAGIEALDAAVDSTVLTSMRLASRTLVERATRWLATNRRPPIDVGWEVSFFGAPVARLVDALPDALMGRESALCRHRRDELVDAGVPVGLATRVAVLPPAYAAMGITEISVANGTDLLEVARVHMTLGESLGMGRLLEHIVALPRRDRWQTMARAALRDDLYAVQDALTAQVLRRTEEGEGAQARVAEWERQDRVMVDRARATLDEILDSDNIDLARMSVGLRLTRGLLRAPSAG